MTANTSRFNQLLSYIYKKTLLICHGHACYYNYYINNKLTIQKKKICDDDDNYDIIKNTLSHNHVLNYNENVYLLWNYFNITKLWRIQYYYYVQSVHKSRCYKNSNQYTHFQIESTFHLKYLTLLKKYIRAAGISRT